jgi:hypothetical protein
LPEDEETELLARVAGLEFLGPLAGGASAFAPLRGRGAARVSESVWEALRPGDPDLSPRPLVSIVIPAYKPEYFRDALASALGQDWPNLEVVVADDCPTDAYTRIVRSCAASSPHPVRYVRNPERLGGVTNLEHVLSLARGEYLKPLNDDDLLDPRCVRRMAACLAALPDVTLVTSRRLVVDSVGAPEPLSGPWQAAFVDDVVVDGEDAAQALFAVLGNYIGEPTTVMFRRRDLLRATGGALSFATVRGRGNIDVQLWMSLLSAGRLAYLGEPLSTFRRNPGQITVDPDVQDTLREGWVAQTALAEEFGLLRPTLPARTTPRAMTLRPWWPPDLSQAYRQAYAAGSAAEALAALAADHRGEVALRLTAARAALAGGDTDAASTQVEQALADYPECLAAWLLAWRVRAARGDLEGSGLAMDQVSPRAALLKVVGTEKSPSGWPLGRGSYLRILGAVRPARLLLRVRSDSPGPGAAKVRVDGRLVREVRVQGQRRVSVELPAADADAIVEVVVDRALKPAFLTEARVVPAEQLASGPG